jgi:adenosylcobinamide-GDP ribazoletransferase
LIGGGGAVGMGLMAPGGALRGLGAAALVLVVTMSLARRWSRILGGLTGDLYGALTEIGELTALLVWAIGGGWR